MRNQHLTIMNRIYEKIFKYVYRIGKKIQEHRKIVEIRNQEQQVIPKISKIINRITNYIPFISTKI